MKKVGIITFLCISIMVVSVGLAIAESKPIQLSLTPDIAIYSKNTTIEGLALSIWGENPQKALALGIVNGSRGDSAGFSWGLLANYSDSYTGVQWAFVNYAKANVLGWQAGLVDFTEGTMKGLQTGFVNYAGNLTGLQLGLLNYSAKAATGVQIGLINLLPQNEWFKKLPNELAPGMVFVNWRF